MKEKDGSGDNKLEGVGTPAYAAPELIRREVPLVNCQEQSTRNSSPILITMNSL